MLTSTTASPTIEAQALALAAWLDRYTAALDADPAYDGGQDDALLAIGELAGGLSDKGFASDLQHHLAGIEEELLMDASPRDYRAGMGGNDPDAYCSDRLGYAIDMARDDAAQAWLAGAQALLTAQPLVLAEAA